MKKQILIFLIILKFIDTGFSQNNYFQKLSKKEQYVIKDFCSTIKDTRISFLISPFIYYSIDNLDSEFNDYISKYGFKKNELNNQEQDTFLLGRNDYFKIINPDSLTSWRKIDPKESFIDPVIENIEKYYNRLGLCSFSRIIFSINNEYALVEYWIHCGFLCGHGETVLMKKENKKWIKINTLIIRQS